MVPCSIIKLSFLFFLFFFFRGKLSEISLFKKITLMSDCFLLTLGENTVMYVSPCLKLLPSWIWLYNENVIEC